MVVQFTIAGQRARLSRDDVIRKLRRVEPAPVRVHGVEIGGILYPVTQALAEATGLDLLDVNTNQARKVFQRLGFKVVRRS